MESPIDTLFQAILDGRLEEALAMLSDAKSRSGLAAAVEGLLEPVLARVGEAWGQERISLAQGYVAGKVAELFLSEAGAEAALSGRGGGRPVVLGNIEDDFHALGRKMVAAFLRLDGWRVIDLGNDVAPEAFLDAAEESGARVIGASSMMLSTARNIARLREAIDARGLRGALRLAVGGAVFAMKPELVREVGGDGTAPNAIAAHALFDRLWAEAIA
jgi:methanogenic corrinoid protein MtbC1